MLYKCYKYIPPKILLLINKPFIYSKISYCPESWGNAGNVYIDPIYKIQKKLMRIIYSKPALSHSNSLFQKSKKFPIHSHHRFKLLRHAHKCFHSRPSHSSHHHFTRTSQSNFEVPSSATAARHRRVEYQCASMWNDQRSEHSHRRRSSGLLWDATCLACSVTES